MPSHRRVSAGAHSGLPGTFERVRSKVRRYHASIKAWKAGRDLTGRQNRGWRDAHHPGGVPVQLRINIGDTVIVEVVDGELHVKSLASAINNARRIMRQLVPDGVSFADELIADCWAESSGDGD
ncbi:hypothetical protein [Methylobacterium frigidaeris]|uniref:Uncharacterized protein n=1 Tax=Methylobacterium frigidaeris TaxID=2038277 RepID=A0AA37HCN2_9HYPH|nr:hypothetical protein [Methylobacterium frigidaeris]GJD63253.1 hypothetical protein MPEAHAMD_3417 [Methylobacterium frigidaeris]